MALFNKDGSFKIESINKLPYEEYEDKLPSKLPM